MTLKAETPCRSDRTQPGQAVRGLLSWIAETDRKFRVAQNRIDQYADRF